MKLAQNEQGGINVLIVPLIVAVLFFLGAVAFGAWAYMERSKYKEDTDEIVAVAVANAEKNTSTKKDNEFLEREKEPYVDYKAPAVFGNITYKYPKTWSGYVTDTSDKLVVVMHPDVVSGNQNTKNALKVQVENTDYEKTLARYESGVKEGALRASPFRLEKVPSELGTRFDGEIADGVQGSVVVLPLRDKTIVISTESNDFVNDLNKIILPNFSYSP